MPQGVFVGAAGIQHDRAFLRGHGCELLLGDPALRVRFVDSKGEETQASWGDLLERGELDAVEDGKNYVLVALGPRVGIGTESWGNRPTIGIAAAEP